MDFDLLQNGLLQSLVLAILSYGVMIPFRLVKFADLTAEGAYPLGGVLCATLMLKGYHPLLALFVGSLGAGCLGIATGLIHLWLKVDTLLAGIIVSTMVYSVNLNMMGKPNVALFKAYGLFQSEALVAPIIFLSFCCLAIFLFFKYFFKTEVGLKLRAVGLNPDFARKQGISIHSYLLLGLFFGAFLSGLAGAFTVQLHYYVDIGMGVGIVIHALAGLMIGEAIVGQQPLYRQLLAPLIGAICYQQLQGIVLSLGLPPADLKFFTGSLVLIVLALNKKKS